MADAISFSHVSKSFKLSHQAQRTPIGFWRRLIPRRTNWNESFGALRDVSLSVSHGETVGLIGSNGSGKSTILKLIARIIHPTRGEVKADGRVAAILELGAGFHPELTGRDNVFLNASIMGLRQRETSAIYDDIVSFSELERFIDTPVKYYSSGMYARLAFAVAINVNPDILLIDEALSVGDQAFQAKCVAQVLDMKQKGATILVVSHDLETIQVLCDRVIWLDNGQVRDVGNAPDVVTAYLDHMSRKAQAEESGNDAIAVAHDTRTKGTGEVHITNVELCDGRGYVRESFVTGGAMTLRVHYRTERPVVDPVFVLSVYHQSGVLVSGINSGAGGLHIPLLEGEGIVAYDISSLPLLEGYYAATISVQERQGKNVYDTLEHPRAFRVYAGKSRERFGLTSLQGEWRTFAQDTAEMVHSSMP